MPVLLHETHPNWEPRKSVSLAQVARQSAVDMITVTIGGDDAGFAKVLKEGVLDYAPVTPEPIEANRAAIESCGLFGRPLHASGIISNPITAVVHFGLGGNVADAAISFSESKFLWQTAVELNAMLRAAADSAKVHFVEAVSRSASGDSSVGFLGHSPCSEEPWLYGFVRKGGVPPVSDRSFHPNTVGHTGYAQLLETYIRSHIDSGSLLTESGMPANPGLEDS